MKLLEFGVDAVATTAEGNVEVAASRGKSMDSIVAMRGADKGFAR
jgi:hypothetical protein